MQRLMIDSSPMPPAFAFVLLVVMVGVLFSGTRSQAAHVNPTVIATIPVETRPRGVGVNSTMNRVYVTNGVASPPSSVSVIDGRANAVVATVPVGIDPFDVDVNPSTNRVYVTHPILNGVSVIDGASNAVIATVGVGQIPGGVGVNAVTNRVYVATGDGVSVLDGATNAVVATVPVGASPEGVGVNPITNRVYVANFSSNDISVINGDTNAVVATVPVGTNPEGVGVNPTTNRVYVANVGSNDVSVIDGATNAVVATVPVGAGPLDVGVNPTTNHVYVANRGLPPATPPGNDVSVIDGATNAVVATVLVGTSPFGVGVNPTTDRVYAANSSSNNVSVIANAASTPSVDIDIKPGGEPNSINLGSLGAIPVAILTTGSIEATTVDPSSVCFGDAEAPAERDCGEKHGTGHIEDVDGDRDSDLLLHYETAQTGIDSGDTQACLTGETFDGTSIEGCDAVRIVPLRLDSDGDGWGDAMEADLQTDQFAACSVDAGHNAWPTDINNDTFIDIGDIAAIAGSFGWPVPPTPPRHDVAPDPADGFVDIADTVRLARLFGRSCAP